jgi:hypothetical protein
VGCHERGAFDNTGKGFWSHTLKLGGTDMSHENRPWNVSLTTRYEIHSKQGGRDPTPWQTLTLELGLGRKVSERDRLGVVGHHWRQTTDVSGAAATDIGRYRLPGLAAEIQFPLWRSISGKTRVGSDFGARFVSQGPFAILELNSPY